MNTKTANAKKTNPTRLRISGTSSALRRVFSKAGLCFFAEVGAGGAERFARGRREHDVAELQTGGQLAALLRSAEHLDAVLEILEARMLLQRLRRDFDRDVPVGEVADVDHGVGLPEMA